MADAKNKLEEISVEAPFPAEVDVEDEVELLFVAVEDVWLVPEPEVEVVFDPLEVEVDDVPEGSVTPAHERLYNGVVLKVASLVLLPRIPKLGFGVVGAASCRTYHQVLILPKADAHPISSQYVFALAKLGIP